MVVRLRFPVRSFRRGLRRERAAAGGVREPAAVGCPPLPGYAAGVFFGRRADKHDRLRGERYDRYRPAQNVCLFGTGDRAGDIPGPILQRPDTGRKVLHVRLPRAGPDRSGADSGVCSALIERDGGFTTVIESM